MRGIAVQPCARHGGQITVLLAKAQPPLSIPRLTELSRALGTSSQDRAQAQTRSGLSVHVSEWPWPHPEVTSGTSRTSSLPEDEANTEGRGQGRANMSLACPVWEGPPWGMTSLCHVKPIVVKAFCCCSQKIPTLFLSLQLWGVSVAPSPTRIPRLTGGIRVLEVSLIITTNSS